MIDINATRLKRALAGAACMLALAGCRSAGEEASPEPNLPTDPGPLVAGAIVWAAGDTIHVGELIIDTDKPVRALVQGNGRIYFTQGQSDVVWVTDGGPPRRSRVHAADLTTSADGRYLGYLDVVHRPWSSTVVDLRSGEVVVHDAEGMGSADDDLADLYEDAQPSVLGFEGDELYVRTASSRVLSWDAGTRARSEHPAPYGSFFFAPGDSGGGRVLPGLIRDGRLVVPDDPYRSTNWGHISPDGSIALMRPFDEHGDRVGRQTLAFQVDSGRRLPFAFHGRWFVLGGWTGSGTAYGFTYDRSPFGPHSVRLVTCEITLQQRRCRTLRMVQPPRHESVIFPNGTGEGDY